MICLCSADNALSESNCKYTAPNSLSLEQTLALTPGSVSACKYPALKCEDLTAMGRHKQSLSTGSVQPNFPALPSSTLGLRWFVSPLIRTPASFSILFVCWAERLASWQ